jgi:hypothetical protein
MPTVIGVGQLGKWMAETAKAFFVVTQMQIDGVGNPAHKKFAQGFVGR